MCFPAPPSSKQRENSVDAERMTGSLRRCPRQNTFGLLRKALQQDRSERRSTACASGHSASERDENAAGERFQHPARHEAGFTLIEMLVAATLLATVAAMVFSSLLTTTRAIDAGREHTAKEQRIRQLLTLMAEEIALSKKDNVFPWVGVNGTQDGQPADTLAILALSHPSNTSSLNGSERVRVVYTRERDRLIRFVRRNLYSLTDESLDQTELADNVSGFNVRYYDAQSRVWLDDWQATEPPKALLLEVTFQQPNYAPWTIREWITIGAS